MTCEEIRKQAQSVHSTCRPIMNTLKPAPKAAEPAAKGKAADSAKTDGKGNEAVRKDFMLKYFFSFFLFGVIFG